MASTARVKAATATATAATATPLIVHEKRGALQLVPFPKECPPSQSQNQSPGASGPALGSCLGAWAVGLAITGFGLAAAGDELGTTGCSLVASFVRLLAGASWCVGRLEQVNIIYFKFILTLVGNKTLGPSRRARAARG